MFYSGAPFGAPPFFIFPKVKCVFKRHMTTAPRQNIPLYLAPRKMNRRSLKSEFLKHFKIKIKVIAISLAYLLSSFSDAPTALTIYVFLKSLIKGILLLSTLMYITFFKAQLCGSLLCFFFFNDE
jgi:hypothetical protein